MQILLCYIHLFTLTFVHSTHILIVLLHYCWFLNYLHSIRGQASAPSLFDKSFIVEGTDHHHLSFIPPLHEKQGIIFAELGLSFSQPRRLHLIWNTLPLGPHRATRLKPVLQHVSKEGWAAVKVICEHTVALALESVIVQQVQHHSICQSQVRSRYPLAESASTQAFILHLCGFFGMYCRKPSLPLKPTMLSSIERFSEGV